MPYIMSVVIAAILLLPGIVMAILPVPGALYMFVVAAVFGWYEGFVHMSGWDIGILATITAVTLFVEFISGVLGAKWGGASWTSIFWGVVGLFIGSAVIPVPIFGSLAGMFLGILAAEWYRTQDARRAQAAAVGSFMGWLAGAGFKLVSAVVFLILFVIFALKA